MNQAREAILDNGRLKLAYKQWGDPSGLPVIQLHGWLDNAGSFDALNRLLDHGKFNLIALDLPGHGLSEHRAPHEIYHLTEYVVDCERFVRALGLKSFYLVGHSLGGAIAAMWAAAKPDRVKKLFLIDALGPLSSPEEKIAHQLGSAVDKALETPGTLPVYPSRAAAAEARKKVNPDLDDASVSTLLSRGLKPCDGGFTWRTDRRLRHPSLTRFSEAQVVAFLSSIQCPVAGVFAENGLPKFSQRFESRVKVIKDFRYTILPGGHHLHMQAPAVKVADSIRHFFLK